MGTLSWNDIKNEDLKDSDYLVKSFRRYLRKECGYSTEEARFAADVIENPYGKIADVTKTYETTAEVCGKTYEIYFCTAEDCSPKLFEFYMLVDVNSLKEKYDDSNCLQGEERTWFAYFLSKKVFVFPTKK